MDTPKIIAMYLPQFHRIPENDKWWGEGFTEWVSARNAKPLFDGHYQPHIPLNENYYDLLDRKTMEWQADLMHQYGVDGICIYHYWFKDGRRVLEKPAENLLEWKDIDMPFCFCWASEAWARSWSKIKDKNVWANTFENGEKENDDGILLEQDYGRDAEWKEHFKYLLPFFKDDRYIKIANKPVIVIYKANQIGCIKDMIKTFRELALANGLQGIYVIGGFTEGLDNETIDATLFHEPLHANRKVLQGVYENGIRRVSYIDVWSNILSAQGTGKTYYGGFVGYDDTPRRGKEGVVVENSTPELFGGFLAQLLAKNEASGNEITFINAWNEWGEGMHLEPDERNGVAFLEKVKEAKRVYKDLIPYFKDIKPHDDEDRNEKHELYLNDLDIWMRLRENGKSIEKWLMAKECFKVAIYGYGIMGRHLETELSQSRTIKLEYIIDKQKDLLHTTTPVYDPREQLTSVDIIIVASYYFFDNAKDLLPIGANVVSLGSILHSLDNE